MGVVLSQGEGISDLPPTPPGNEQHTLPQNHYFGGAVCQASVLYYHSSAARGCKRWSVGCGINCNAAWDFGSRP